MSLWAAPTETYAVQASALTDVMVRKMDSLYGFVAMLADRRIDTVLIGPGAGVGQKTADLSLECLHKNKRLILDADGLTSMAGQLSQLQDYGEREILLTPHEGEFKRLFPEISLEANRLEAARMAAKAAGAVIILKGVSTLIASPDGRIAINTNAPAWLSVGGTGDVLAGMAAGPCGAGHADV